MTITVFNPNWFYSEVLSEEQHATIADLFQEFLDNDDNFQNPWDGKLLSSFMHDNNTIAPWNEFLDVIKPVCANLINTLKPNCGVKLQPQQIWANKYREHEYQETHIHSSPVVHMSMVYFHQVSDDDTSFKFVNNNFSEYSASGLYELFDIPNQQISTPKVQQGTLMFFPAFYPHYVSPHLKSDYERITFSGNFGIVPVD